MLKPNALYPVDILRYDELTVEELEQHFAEEESIILPKLERHDRNRVFAEHQAMRWWLTRGILPPKPILEAHAKLEDEIADRTGIMSLKSKVV